MSTAASASISTNGIVFEALNRENYSNWRALVKNYLMGKNLWYGIITDSDDEEKQKEKAKREESESDVEDDEEEQKEEKTEQEKGDSHDEEKEKKEKEKRKKKKEKAKKEELEWKNRRALHAIQLSCGKALSQIKNCEKANAAWIQLKTSFKEDVKAYTISGTTSGFSDKENMAQPRTLVRKGFLDDAKLSIDISYEDIFSKFPDGRTALHAAVKEGEIDIVKQLAKMGKQRLLRMQDKKGYTALALAAKVTDNKEMAEWMVRYGGEDLLTIAAKAEEEDDDDDDDDGVHEIPVLLASAKGNQEMTRYLFNHTPWPRLTQYNNGVVLLSRCIYNEIFDVAAAIIQRYGWQSVPLSHPKQKIFRPICALAHMPSAFPSTGIKLNCFQRLIYNILRVEDINNDNIKVVFHEPRDIEESYSMKNTLPGRLFGLFQQLIQTRILLKSDVFDKIYKQKMNHYLVLEILKCLCKRISRFSEAEMVEVSAYDAMLQAAKNGITEIIDLMAAANHYLLSAKDGSKRGIFAHAILNRQEEVFQLIADIGNKGIVRSSEDVLGNNLLHIAAELGPPRYLDRISNAALQMQRELQWFQDVKSVVPRRCHHAKDASGKMASEVFSAEHNDLLKSAQQWAKDTASSFTLVGTLIITIMFAAAFTVPGGTDDKEGIPILLDKDKELFKFFIISDAASLITSSSSVLMFIGILTSRYAEEDFKMTLPLRFLFGLVTLFLSVASMMCAFCAALALLLKGHFRIVIAAMWLALLPILVLVPSLLSLAYEIFKSTLRCDKLAAIKEEK